MTLSEVIQQLHERKVSCGVQTQLGGMIQAWVGDDILGLTVKEFSACDVDQIGEWLDSMSRQRFPQSNRHAFKVAAPIEVGH